MLGSSLLAASVFFVSLASAPYPHASRAAGHVYERVTYTAAQHYSDNTVAIVVPATYKAGSSVDYVVHFHGWRNNVRNVLRRYRLAEQLDASGLNAILVVPQGPLDAPDSGFGKLELDTGGFARFMNDVTDELVSRHVIDTHSIGRIVLSAHSGGYGGEGGVLLRGGMNDRITDVLLFDCAYGYEDAYVSWASAPGHRLLSVFTDDTIEGNYGLMARLHPSYPGLLIRIATRALSLADIQSDEPEFLLTTDLEHDELLQKDEWFKLFLQSTRLAHAAQ